MPVLARERIAEVLQPFVAQGPYLLELRGEAIEQISAYLDLLVRWNARVNLTSIRAPEEMVQRHFGESLFTAAVLRSRFRPGAELLDFGSGAGFPGLPMQLALPGLRVTVAESQARKVAFLREVIRTLALPSEVWPRRVEEMPPSRRFHAVTMRAVDRMGEMRSAALARLQDDGWLALLTGRHLETGAEVEVFSLPTSEHRQLILQHVPRGTQLR